MLRKEHNLRMSEKGILWRIFEPKGVEMTGDWKKIPTARNSIIFALYQIILRWPNQGRSHGRCIYTYQACGEEKCVQNIGSIA
jgi:hypothetical protein